MFEFMKKMLLDYSVLVDDLAEVVILVYKFKYF